MSDLDAVRKAYMDAVSKSKVALGSPSLWSTSHDAGLAAVVEWAMNRAEAAVPTYGYLTQSNAQAPWEHVRAARDALLKDLTERGD